MSFVEDTFLLTQLVCLLLTSLCLRLGDRWIDIFICRDRFLYSLGCAAELADLLRCREVEICFLKRFWKIRGCD